MSKFNIGNYKLPHMVPFRQNKETISSSGISNDSTDAVEAWKNFKSAYVNRQFKGNDERLGPITPEENIKEYNREKNEFYYDTNTKKLRLIPTDDAEMKDQTFLDTLDSFQLAPED